MYEVLSGVDKITDSMAKRNRRQMHMAYAEVKKRNFIGFDSVPIDWPRMCGFIYWIVWLNRTNSRPTDYCLKGYLFIQIWPSSEREFTLIKFHTHLNRSNEQV